MRRAKDWKTDGDNTVACATAGTVAGDWNYCWLHSTASPGGAVVAALVRAKPGGEVQAIFDKALAKE